MRCAPECATGYPTALLDDWGRGAQEWTGRSPRHEAFVYFINGAKERAPAAALELMRRIS
jgi:hypothetical protein